MNERHGTHVILSAITPAYDSVDAERLTYPNLRDALKSQSLPAFIKRSGFELWRKRLKFDPATMQEDLSSTYLLNAAYRLQRARTMPEKVFWSTQFTTTSVALFGRPLSREVASIAANELGHFSRIVQEYDIDPEFAKPVLDAYRSLVSSRSKPRPRLEARYAMVLQKLHDFFTSEYDQCFACFNGYPPDALLSPHELSKCFNSALDALKARDPAWAKWTVTHNRGAKLSVNINRQQIAIGEKRAPMTIAEARGLLAHEILVHAQRAVHGAKHSRDLAIGLPDYLAAEEGLGVLVESAINGSVPLKVKDRYVDIALALGAWRRRPLLRNEMYVFCYTRAVLRGIINHETLNLEELEKVTWEHVNRIYRGGLGNKYLAVFTKDVAYYQGFIKMANYLQNAARRGRLTDSLAYIYRGKFDPTNRGHRSKVGQHEY
jgi:hypothetical protein